MELRHLRYFVAVGEEENIRRASKRLSIAQPALSRQVQQLESELGCDLLHRKPRGVELTDAGRAFMHDAREILDMVDRAAKRAKRVSLGELGHLRVGFVESASWAGVFPQTIERFRRRSPGVTLDIVPMSSASQLSALADGHLDVGFCYVFAELPDPIASEPIDRHDVVLAAPRCFGWPGDNPVALRDLADEPMVWLRRQAAPHYVDLLVAGAAAKAFSPKVVQEVDDETTLLSLVAAGIGVGFVNSANEHRKPAAVEFLNLADMDASLDLHIAWRRSHHADALERFVREAIGSSNHPAGGVARPCTGSV